jgi:hypothetical protein
MTNEELLQQAKDQWAQKLERKDWNALSQEYIDNDVPAHHYESAALLAIQSAREEGRKEGADVIGDALGDLDDIAPHHNHDRTYRTVDGVRQFLAESHEKLTAPGR